LDIYGEARLKRDQDFIHGDHINYNAQSEIFLVNNSPVAKGLQPHRVKAIIQSHPKAAPESDSKLERK
jgi:lipopolysaccharide export system protein LptA